jgi:glycosyltransferase involved in cell wall biosynthesis
MKSILIFSEFYYPDLLSSGYYMTEIAEKLALKHQVTVITTGESTHVTNEITNNVSIIRIPKKNFNKNILFQRLINFIYLSFQFYLIGRKKINRNSEVICVTNPSLFIPVIAYLKKVRKFRLTYFIHDVFPENLIATNILKSVNPFYKIIYWIFQKSFFQSNRIVTCGRDMKLLFEHKLPDYLGEVLFIPNWGETDKIYPDNNLKKETLKEHNIESKFIFQFAGNLGRGQGINNLLTAVKTINDPKVHFLFFGKGVYENELKGFSQDQKITYGGTFERNQSNKYLNACDVSIISLQEGMLGLGVPSKSYNILSAGKPILYIGEKSSEIGLLVEENKIGKICQSGSVDSIIDGINWFLSIDKNELTEISQRALNISKFYSKEKILAEYMNLY